MVSDICLTELSLEGRPPKLPNITASTSQAARLLGPLKPTKTRRSLSRAGSSERRQHCGDRSKMSCLANLATAGKAARPFARLGHFWGVRRHSVQSLPGTLP